MPDHEYDNYPRMFSLSTLNIKHHGYWDYFFHPIRTDFVGESGYGKSMIGDMLQLVFVGSSVFKSGTEVNTDTKDPRKPEGMVLEQSNQGRYGYILLNIEVALEKFIAIGVYIEASVGRTSPFIVQAGFDWRAGARLVPLTAPLFHYDFLQDDKLLPMETFQEKMHNLMSDEIRVAEVFRNRTKHYHQLLQYNNILPVDVENDSKRLKNYAQILQSFARGKGFKNDSENLKAFLFGNEDAEDSLKQLEKESKQLKLALEQYYENKREVSKIVKAGETLSDMQDVAQRRKEARQAQLTADVAAPHKELERSETTIAEHTSSLSSIRYQLLLIDERTKAAALDASRRELEIYQDDSATLEALRERQLHTKACIEKLAKEREVLAPSHQKAVETAAQLERVEGWLGNYSQSLEMLSERFATQMRHYKDKARLEALTSYLEQAGLLGEFEESLWSRNVKLARTESEKRLEEIDKELELLTTLQSFANITDPNSLARWALDRDEPLTREQEGLLLHFQALPRTEPERADGKRFLPEPDDVFSNLKVEGQGEDGFWFDLAGIYEFIPESPLHLTAKDRAEALPYLEETYAESHERVEALRMERETLQRLQTVLTEHGYTQEEADIFTARAEIDAFTPDETLPKLQEEFDMHLGLYANSDILRRETESVQSSYEEVETTLKEQEVKSIGLTYDIKHLEEKLGARDVDNLKATMADASKDLEVLRRESREYENQPKHKAEEGVFKKTLAEMSKENLDALKGKLIGEEATLEERIRSAMEAVPSIQKRLREAQIAFESELMYSVDLRDISSEIEPEEARRAFEALDKDFSVTRASFIREYVLEEHYRLGRELDVAHIARTTFPMIFSKDSELSLANQVAQYLKSLNEKNRELEGSSAEAISRIFSDVRKNYNKYLETIGHLRRFFSGEDTRITGGYKVKLKSHLSSRYPVAWLDDVRNVISLASSPIFSEDVSLQDIVMDAFRRHARGTETPDLRKLLDPKSYFDLSFTLQNVREETSGSAGQAYTAIALLCIARLSLIEDNRSGIKQGVKFMPIDEAEGIGSNYRTLLDLALTHGYQVVSMSIRSISDGMKDGGQTIYSLVPNPDHSLGINSPPFYDLGHHHEHARKLYSKR